MVIDFHVSKKVNKFLGQQNLTVPRVGSVTLYLAPISLVTVIADVEIIF